MKEIVIYIDDTHDKETQEEIAQMLKLLCDNLGVDGIDCHEWMLEKIQPPKECR